MDDFQTALVRARNLAMRKRKEAEKLFAEGKILQRESYAIDSLVDDLKQVYDRVHGAGDGSKVGL